MCPGNDSTAPGRLASVEHIVVLMLENRSFDHMLGYLALDKTFPHPIDGLAAGMHNDHQGTMYPAFLLPTTSMASFETPEHDGPHVDAQLVCHGAGFAGDYIESRNPQDRATAADPQHCVVMGYHDGQQLYAF